MNSLRNSMAFCRKCVTVQAFWHRNVKKPKRNQDFPRKTSIFLSKSMVCNRKSMNSCRNSMVFCRTCVTVQAFWYRNVKKTRRNQWFQWNTSIVLNKSMVCNRKSRNSLRNLMLCPERLQPADCRSPTVPTPTPRIPYIYIYPNSRSTAQRTLCYIYIYIHCIIYAHTCVVFFVIHNSPM